ncbi:MAG TPA: Spy/CpxP family protein refolding chaperone [Phenylobacterium sp.]|nr:Spy/CpxP family protein refolding chaperone [Phenylobacterium sp.]
MKRLLLLSLAPAALALATAAYAQAPAPHHAGGPPEMHHPDMKAMHEAMMKQHLEDLKIVLRLRPDQEAALQAFAAAHHPPEMGEMHDRMFGGPEAKPMSTPERLDEMAKHEAAMAAEHQKMAQALKTFYAALSPDQQKVFDALQRLQGPHGMHGGHGMHMMMMGGPGMMGGPQMMIMKHREGGPPPPGEE